jgi:hypothetical protein
MQIQDLARAYRTKTDEELLQLVGDPEQLTPEAHAALKSELAQRRIDGAAYLNVQEETGQSELGQQRTSWTPLLRESQSVGEFVAEVFRVYHGHFWLFVKLIAPTVVVGYIAIVMGRNEGREIARHLPRGFEILGHETEILEIWFANFVGFLVSWMASASRSSQHFHNPGNLSLVRGLNPTLSGVGATNQIRRVLVRHLVIFPMAMKWTSRK